MRNRQNEKSSGGSRAVVLRLLAEEAVFAGGEDLSRVFRHRYVLAHYLGLSGPILVVFLLFNPTAMLHAPHMPSVVLGIVAMLASVAGYVAVVRAVLQRLRVALFVPLTPGLVLGAAVLMLTVQIVGAQTGMDGQWSALRSHLLMVGITLYLEAAATLVLRGPVPRAQAALRAERPPGPPPVVAAPVVVEADVAEAEPEPEPPEALRDLLRLEAQGNYVAVVSAGGRHLLPGPFAAMLARLPEGQGRRVHRSHWVAARAVVAARRNGRDYVIETEDGARVPVAAGQVAEVRQWVEAALRDRRSRDGGALPGNGGGSGPGNGAVSVVRRKA